ncbi:MAG: PEP-CTERM sorting domain-containing protein [Pirellulales bacterium]|nr:PEP-CTERM sorting domain-containing protein [Pirellulales bacterium]
MLRKFLCVAVLAAFATTAQAGTLGSALTFNGLEDEIQASSSRVNVIDQDNSGGISAGDLVYGFVDFNQILQDSSFNFDVTTIGSLAGVFAVEVGTPTGNVFPLGAVSSPPNSGLNLASLVDPALAPFIGATDQFAILGNSSNINTAAFTETVTTARGFGDGFTAAPSGGATPDGLLGFDSTWDVELTANFTTADDFFLFFDGGAFGLQTGGATITSQPGLGGAAFVPVDTTLPPGGTPSGLTSDIALDLTLVTPSPTNGFGFSGDASFRINAVPEPTSIAAFAGIAALGLGARRRRKAAKA